MVFSYSTATSECIASGNISLATDIVHSQTVNKTLNNTCITPAILTVSRTVLVTGKKLRPVSAMLSVATCTRNLWTCKEFRIKQIISEVTWGRGDYCSSIVLDLARCSIYIYWVLLTRISAVYCLWFNYYLSGNLKPVWGEIFLSRDPPSLLCDGYRFFPRGKQSGTNH